MKNTRFITLLSSFNKKELNNFGCYLQSFYPNMKLAIALYSYLEKQYPHFPKKNLTFEALVNGLQDKPANGAKTKKHILNTLSDLYNWSQDFLIWQHQINTPFKKGVMWLQVLDARNMNHEYQLKAAQMSKWLDKEKATNAWDHLDHLSFHHHVWEHHATKRHVIDPVSLNGCMVELDLFYLLSKMSYGTEMVNRMSMFKEAVDISLLDDLAAKSENYPKNLLMEAARLQYKLAKNKEEADYLALKEFFLRKGAKLSAASKLAALQYLINFTALMIRSGRSGYFDEAFYFYKQMIKPGLQGQADHISIHNFLNTVSAAIGAKKLKWTADFIKKYGPLLSAEIREATVCFASAQLAFVKGQYRSESFAKLQSLKYPDPIFAIRAKTLILRNLYEAGYERSYLLLMNLALRKFLTRNKKLNPEFLNSCMNFTECYSELVNKRMPRPNFIEKIKATQPLFLDLWLLEKAQDLEQ